MKNKTELTKQINKLLKNNIIYVDELDLINKSNNRFGIILLIIKKLD